MIHTQLMGQGCILCIKTTLMGKKKDSKHNKSKTVVYSEAYHCPAKPQANLSLEKKRKQIVTLNSPSSGQVPTYLVSQSYCCFQSVCSEEACPALTMPPQLFPIKCSISGFNTSNILKISRELFIALNKCQYLKFQLINISNNLAFPLLHMWVGSPRAIRSSDRHEKSVCSTTAQMLYLC